MKQRVHIITLGVDDLDRAAKFYDALGWQRAENCPPGLVAYDLYGATLGQISIRWIAHQHDGDHRKLEQGKKENYLKRRIVSAQKFDEDIMGRKYRECGQGIGGPTHV